MSAIRWRIECAEVARAARFELIFESYPALGQTQNRTQERELRMQDALMMLFTVIFFAVAFLYVKACQKLR